MATRSLYKVDKAFWYKGIYIEADSLLPLFDSQAKYLPVSVPEVEKLVEVIADTVETAVAREDAADEPVKAKPRRKADHGLDV